MNLEKLTAERLTASIRDSVTSVGGKIEAITMSSKGGVVNEGAVPEKEEKKEKTGVVRLVRRSDRRDERTRRLQHEVVALDRAEAEADKYVELFAGFRRKCEELSAAAMERRKANEDHSGDKSRMKGGATFEANANSGSDSRLGAENQDYIYEDGYFVMEVYFAIFHSHSIAGLKAFDSVHTNYSVTDSSKRSLLTIALLVFSVEGDERLWEILRFLAYRQSTDAAVRALKKTLIFLDIDPESLIELCQQIVSGSSFPIITSLHMAAFLKKCARQFPAYGDDFRKGVFPCVAIMCHDDVWLCPCPCPWLYLCLCLYACLCACIYLNACAL